MRHHSNVGTSSVANPSAAEEVRVPVLVVDDDDAHLQIGSLILRQAGYQVRTAHTTAEARREIAEHRPAVIVLDVGLPEEDGISFGTKLRRDRGNDDIGIVLYSAYGDVVDQRRIRASGCDAYLTKPARSTVYLDAIKDSLARRRPAAAP